MPLPLKKKFCILWQNETSFTGLLGTHLERQFSAYYHWLPDDKQSFAWKARESDIWKSINISNDNDKLLIRSRKKGNKRKKTTFETCSHAVVRAWTIDNSNNTYLLSYLGNINVRKLFYVIHPIINHELQHALSKPEKYQDSLLLIIGLVGM